MSKRTIKADATEEEDNTEKKQRPTVYAPKFFHSNEIQTGKMEFGLQYLPPGGKPGMANRELTFNADNVELRTKSPDGPDLLIVTFFMPRGSPDCKISFLVYHKTAEAKGFRVVHGRGKGKVEMMATEEESGFQIIGPEFWMIINGKRKKSPDLLSQLAAIAKERELMAKVLLIRKEYEEAVLPYLPVSIQFTGAMVLGSLLPSVTVELRKGQLEDAEKQLV